MLFQFELIGFEWIIGLALVFGLALIFTVITEQSFNTFLIWITIFIVFPVWAGLLPVWTLILCIIILVIVIYLEIQNKRDVD